MNLSAQIFRMQSLRELTWLHKAALVFLPLAVVIHLIYYQPSPAFFDFSAYYAAGNILNHAPAELYYPPTYSKFYMAMKPGRLVEGRIMGYLYPPSFALALWPFGYLSYPVAYLIWSCLGFAAVFFLYQAIGGLCRFYHSPAITPFLQSLAYGTILTFFSILDGQVSIFICLFFAYFLLALRMRKILFAAFWFFLMIQIKPHLVLPFFLYLLGAREWKLCTLVILFSLLAYFFTGFLIDESVWQNYLALLLHAQSQTLELGAHFRAMLNLRGILTSGPRSSLWVEHVSFAAYALFNLGCFIYPLLKKQKAADILSIALFAPFAFLLSPWLHIHDLVILLPACILLLCMLRFSHKEKWMVPVYFFSSYPMIFAMKITGLYEYRFALLWLCGLSLYLAFFHSRSARTAGAEDYADFTLPSSANPVGNGSVHE